MTTEEDWETRYERVMRERDSLPEVAAKPCVECPWRRDSTAGHLGPHSAEEWVEIAHGESAIACHITIKSNQVDDDGNASWAQPGMRQCAGAAIFRANIMKTPRHPKVAVGKADRETVFGWNDEFIKHHEGEE